MNYSFYGGRRGESFYFAAQYKSKEEMVNEFRKGDNYQTVHYDEYVLIKNSNPDDPDNGNIYQRGYNFTEGDGGAKFIANILGPIGKTPKIKFSVKTNEPEEGASIWVDPEGSSENPKITIGIPRGFKGDKGDTGDQGQQGIQGIQGEPGRSDIVIADPPEADVLDAAQYDIGSLCFVTVPEGGTV